jgi:hypothetical protein
MWILFDKGTSGTAQSAQKKARQSPLKSKPELQRNAGATTNVLPPFASDNNYGVGA